MNIKVCSIATIQQDQINLYFQSGQLDPVNMYMQ